MDSRRSELLRLIRTRGTLEVAGIDRQLGVSAETVRRDLRSLESQGLIRRAYGLAYPVESGAFESSLETRRHTHVEEKHRIAQAAVARLGEAQTVFVDEGFLPELVARRLPADRPLTVVTASLPVATMLSARADTQVMVLGGRVRGGTLGIVDHWATDILSRLTIDLAYLGANGVSLERGLTTPDTAVAVVKAAAVRASLRRIFVGAHTKFGTVSFARFAEVNDFEALITGRELTESAARLISSDGATLVRV